MVKSLRFYVLIVRKKNPEKRLKTRPLHGMTPQCPCASGIYSLIVAYLLRIWAMRHPWPFFKLRYRARWRRQCTSTSSEAR